MKESLRLWGVIKNVRMSQNLWHGLKPLLTQFGFHHRLESILGLHKLPTASAMYPSMHTHLKAKSTKMKTLLYIAPCSAA